MTKGKHLKLMDIANELREEFDASEGEMMWVVSEYSAFNTIPEMRKRDIEVGWYSDKMRKMFAKLLTNDGGEAVYIAENENPPLLSTYSHLKDILSKKELKKLKAATEDDIYKFLIL